MAFRFFHPTLKLLLAVYVDDFKMSGPSDSMKKGWELISSKIDMDSPTPMGGYLGCEHHSQSSPLGRAGHPFAHVFDKTLPDPAAKPASVAHTEDYIEYFPEEDLVIHNHIQPGKSLYKPSEQETKAYKLGLHRLTEINPVKSEEPIDQ